MLGNLGNEKSTSELGKVCVFGATGFVGSAIVNELERQGVDWIGISRSANTHPNIVEASLSDTALLQDIISEYSCVVNAMGSFKPADFESNTKHVFQTFWENIQLFSELLSKSNITQLLHISSGGTVYGESQGVASVETDWLKPISWYGKAKVIEESMLEKVALQSGFTYTCARVSNPFGNSRFSSHGFVDVLINTVRNGGIFNTFNNPLYCRDFIHCQDMASALVKLLESRNSEQVEVFNVGSGESISLLDILSIAQAVRPDFEYKLERLTTDYDVVQSMLSVNKLEAFGVNTNSFITVEQYLKEKLMG
ncbi:NAD-dependent epimerase/dehydratase family protein [Pseudoalteromonas sp. YIC-656]|uniref:NAD-dependent epimerase/dehydratase family protein n=1 Tax=Pseudoalteromonas pernae TaxID=3118054 RepID=UPI0032427546